MVKKVFVPMLVLALITSLSGCSLSNLPTIGNAEKKEDKTRVVFSANEMEDYSAYVWKNSGDLQADLSGTAKQKNPFIKAAYDTGSFDKYSTDEPFGEHKILWFTKETLKNIPVVDANNGDKVLLVSSTGDIAPIIWERYLDYGYTIGLANLKSYAGHFYISTKEDTSKQTVNKRPQIAEGSDVSSIKDLGAEIIYFDGIGGKKLTKVSKAGTIENLKEDETYVANLYIGSFYQDYSFKASYRAFANFERFEHPYYSYLHSNCIEAEIPPYLKTGYYMIDGYGLIKYIAKGDSDSSPTNVPIILYNEDGSVKEDPSVYYRLDSDGVITPSVDNTGKSEITVSIGQSENAGETIKKED